MIEKCSYDFPPPWSPSEPHPQAAVFPAPSAGHGGGGGSTGSCLCLLVACAPSTVPALSPLEGQGVLGRQILCLGAPLAEGLLGQAVMLHRHLWRPPPPMAALRLQVPLAAGVLENRQRGNLCWPSCLTSKPSALVKTVGPSS